MKQQNQMAIAAARVCLKLCVEKKLEYQLKDNLTDTERVDLNRTLSAIDELETYIDDVKPNTYYTLIGDGSQPSIARGDTWAASKVD
tara:strand:- start:51 stop:311 length:261 start_codon:yes stop_codon:yes gene_type:complete